MVLTAFYQMCVWCKEEEREKERELKSSFKGRPPKNKNATSHKGSSGI
jgi:hypothetical protein